VTTKLSFDEQRCPHKICMKVGLRSWTKPVELNLKHSMKKKTLCVMTRLKKEKIMLR
jgi:hypothetical protein